MKRFVLRRLVTVLCTTGFLGISSHAMASAFQLWEQDGASIGNYHAGYAAEANDASIAWYNPAGITRIKNQQIVFGADAVMSSFKYKGNVGITENVPILVPPPIFVGTTPATFTFHSVTGQGGQFSVIPSLHYVAPINDWIGFGFSVDAPFGLKTNYGTSTPLRYAATLTSISVVDISPSLGFKVTDKGSLGLGFDVQKAWAEFDSQAVLLTPQPLFSTNVVPGLTATSTNKANDTGYGFHLGALYEFTDCLRAGLSYHSQVVHHLSGSSKFRGDIANALAGGPLETARARANLTLPPYTAFTVYDHFMPQVAVMGSIIYTQWSTFKTLTLNQVAGAISVPPPDFVAASSNIQVSIPENYRNTWNLSVGADYYVTDRITLRGGLGYDETPITNAYRNIPLPDNNRYIIALGGHYQASKAVGLDLGWTHFFFSQAQVNPPPQVTGGQTVTTSGNVNGGADVIGGQVTWDIC